MKNKVNILDQDFYKFTMGDFINKYYADAQASYAIYDKSNLVDDMSYIIENIRRNTEFKKLSKQDFNYLLSLGISKSYVSRIEYILEHVLPKSSWLDWIIDHSDVSSLWPDYTLFEVIDLYLINQELHKHVPENVFSNIRREFNKELSKDKSLYSQLNIVDYGTRRRFSQKHHFEICKKLRKLGVKTSNVLLSKKYGRTPVGTIAHELFMAQKALAPDNLYGFVGNWIKHIKDINYNAGHNHPIILLTDTWTTDHFIEHFDKNMLDEVDGFRHDSGCPYQWTDKILKYVTENSNRKHVTLYYSNQLDPEEILNIVTHFELVKTDIGITIGYAMGTHFTNNYMGILPHNGPQLTMKLHTVNGTRVNKISDDKNKSTE
jgi:nicotinate phosphoribosyltransferase